MCFLNIQLTHFYHIYHMFMLVTCIEENMQMFHVFNNMPSTERNTASINLHIKCIDYIVIKILTQIHCQIPVLFSYMILPMRVKMETKTIHMMISSRLHSSFNRTSLFFADLKSCHIGMITWRESGIMSPMSRALWKFVPFP